MLDLLVLYCLEVLHYLEVQFLLLVLEVLEHLHYLEDQSHLYFLEVLLVRLVLYYPEVLSLIHI